ncbi:hypothetical protein MNBD_GAMMA10-1455 [hydrothermal vent metagenome]|uniref:Uncharacterized protein n=1 Tax=hydrothermal vent metagenome TaxID=652676 RepID=A0A3B0XX21_9ZZZZ
MMQQLEQEKEVLLAVREFIHSLNVDQKVVADISMVVNETSQLSLSNLDAWERIIRREMLRAEETSAPSMVKRWSRSARSVMWLDICSGDGFRREKTLRRISTGAPDSFFFALAVRRLNDWVAQVREAAREKLQIIAEGTDPEHVVNALCATLPHWNSWGRMEDADSQVLMKLISIDRVAEALKSKIVSSTCGPMASILVQVGRTEILDRYLGEIAKNAVQPSVRAKAYRCLLEGRMVWLSGRKWVWTDRQWGKSRYEPVHGERAVYAENSFIEILKLAASDRSAMVRRVAGELLIRELKVIGVEAIKLAELLASDSSASVAERGKFALNRLESSL